MIRLDFSLVTTCRNEMRSFYRWKQNVLDQTRQPSEIVIVDAFSDDGTAEQLFEWATNDKRVQVIQEKGAAAHGRNIAINKAKHVIILSTDMGVRLSPNWCEELITPFELDYRIDVVIGNTCLDKETVKSAASRAEFYLENRVTPTLGPGTVPGNRSVAYAKTVWEKLCGLPEDLTFYADDSVFGRQMVQANVKFAYAPEAMTYWARPQKLKQFFREYFVYGRGDGEAFIKTFAAYRWYLENKIPATFVPIANMIIQLFKPAVLKGIPRALIKGDVVAALYIPILTAGRWFNYSKGYHIGYKHGEAFCQDCRKRLIRNEKGYTTF